MDINTYVYKVVQGWIFPVLMSFWYSKFQLTGRVEEVYISQSVVQLCATCHKWYAAFNHTFAFLESPLWKLEREIPTLFSKDSPEASRLRKFQDSYIQNLNTVIPSLGWTEGLKKSGTIYRSYFIMHWPFLNGDWFLWDLICILPFSRNQFPSLILSPQTPRCPLKVEMTIFLVTKCGLVPRCHLGIVSRRENCSFLSLSFSLLWPLVIFYDLPSSLSQIQHREMMESRLGHTGPCSNPQSSHQLNRASPRICCCCCMRWNECPCFSRLHPLALSVIAAQPSPAHTHWLRKFCTYALHCATPPFCSPRGRS